MKNETASLPAIAEGLEKYLQWLDEIIAARMKTYFEDTEQEQMPEDLLDLMPEPDGDSPLEETLRQLDAEPAEVLTILLALTPLLRPQMLDIFFTKNPVFDRPFSEFGGMRTDPQEGFMPTAETALFLLCGRDVGARVRYRPLFLADHRLYRLLILISPLKGNFRTELSFPLQLSPEYQGYFFSGKVPAPEYSQQFPARRITTHLNWEDLILEPRVMTELEEMLSWLEHRDTLMEGWRLGRVLKPGFRSLFYGPPGTGKSLAASLLGKRTGRDVYRIDLSLIVSKYIGETEKNLAQVFDYAEEKEWILFFDEADALFGKRSATTHANDRYANQEVAFLLQRIEDFPGTIILATNLKNNIDAAFMRRFQSVIYFNKPDKKQRLDLWKKAFGTDVPLAADVDLNALSAQYDLTGGEIVNVLRHAALMAVASRDGKVTLMDILNGIRREFLKDGRVFEPPGMHI